MQVRFRDVLGTIFAILALHFPAIHFHLYHRNNGIDSAMHLVGGVLGAVLWLWVLQATPLRGRAGHPSPLLVALSMVFVSMAASYAWEIYEYYRWRWWPETYVYEHSVPDTLFDVFLGTTGAVATATFYYRVTVQAGADALGRAVAETRRRGRSVVPVPAGLVALRRYSSK